MATGVDPFSGTNTRNLLKHVFAPKIVSSGSDYQVKLDMLNVDNVYISGTVQGQNVPITKTYTTAGTYTYTLPAISPSQKWLISNISLCGGGGGGGGGSGGVGGFSPSFWGNGGTAGGSTSILTTNPYVIPGTSPSPSITIVVGAAGAGGSGGGSGGSGSAGSSGGNTTLTIGTYAPISSSGSAGGIGGVGTGGSLPIGSTTIAVGSGGLGGIGGTGFAPSSGLPGTSGQPGFVTFTVSII